MESKGAAKSYSWLKPVIVSQRKDGHRLPDTDAAIVLKHAPTAPSVPMSGASAAGIEKSANSKEDKLKPPSKDGSDETLAEVAIRIGIFSSSSAAAANVPAASVTASNSICSCNSNNIWNRPLSTSESILSIVLLIAGILTLPLGGFLLMAKGVRIVAGEEHLESKPQSQTPTPTR